MKGMSYSDVLAMPTYERRFFIGLLTRDVTRREEQMEEMRNQAKASGGKGTRQTRVSGQALKNKLKTGEIPNK